tara:strand:- start:1146 stop:2477 length:1332 start_codon:yes stop_codon:yes gene_type:complete
MKNQIIIENKIPNYNKTIYIPGDKSISIRVILIASQAIGKSKAYNLLESEDVKNTIKSMKNLGVKIVKKKNFYEICGVGLNGFKFKDNQILDAGNSGTFARLCCGALANISKDLKITGDKSLSLRDFSRIIKPLRLFGMNFKSKNNKLPLIVKGSEFLRPITYNENKGSSQVKSAIMLASLQTPGTTIIKCVPSRNHTENIFKYCLNVPIKINKIKNYDIIKVQGLKNFFSFNYKIPGDISSAAFFIVLTILSANSKVIIKNVNVNKTRTGVLRILKRMNAKIKLINRKIYNGEEVADVYAESSENLKSINCPKSLNTKTIDEFLLIFLVCTKAKGVSKFKGLEELRHKESDRLKIASKFLRMIGIKINERFDELDIYGKPELRLKKNYVVENFLKDHRVFMMSCIAALTLGGKFIIKDKDSINSSFPDFLKKLEQLGATIKY